MKNFLDKHFLLQSNTAIKLYENTAVGLPIFDFHCHLNPKEIWEDKPYENISQLWLGGDHYKWRLMRMYGISERYITGDASDWEKFEAWAKTVPHILGNPLYHWTHMELQTYFGIEKRLSPETAREIYDECNEKLQNPDFTPRALIKRSNVKFIGTTDDPISTLEFHQLLKNDESFQTTVAPTFRPDGALFIERPNFLSWIGELSHVSGVKIESFEEFLQALKRRVNYFDENGCRASDHDIQKMEYIEGSSEEIAAIFDKRINGGSFQIMNL